MTLELGQIFTQILAFLIMLWIMKKFAWKPLLQIMENRRNKIISEFDQIELERREVRALRNDYHAKLKTIDEQARIKIQQAIQEGKKEAQGIIVETKEKAKQILDKAAEKIENEIHEAKIQLKNDVIDMTVILTEKLLKDNLNSEKQKKLAADYIEKIEIK